MKESNFLFIAMILIIFGFATSSCKKDETTTTTTTTPTINKFAFLKIGNSWNYGLFDNKSIRYDTNISKYEVHADLGNGKFEMYNYTNGIYSNSSFWYQTDNAYGQYNVNGQNDDSLDIILKYDCKINDIYAKIEGGDTISYYKVMALDEQKTVPAGTFKCYRIMKFYPGAPFTNTYFVNKEFGLISFMMIDSFEIRLLSKSF